MKYLVLTACSLIFFVNCGPNISDENQRLIDLTNDKMRHIDGNHRVSIVEDDFKDGDSLYKIRAYYYNQDIIKLVSVLRTPHYERDDYFYFENKSPIFSGHLVNQRDDHEAEEFKFYYKGGKVVESLTWKDTYVPGKKFDHEAFHEYNPNVDSLMKKENERFSFLVTKLELEGIEILHLNENLEANTQ
jgi:hypothetical protein